MALTLFEKMGNWFDRFLERRLPTVSAINRKYARPKIVMSPWVKYSLLGLRLYLIVLVLIMALKFYLTVKGG